MSVKTHFDGNWRIRTKYQPHEDKLYVERTQVNRDAILEQNKRHRLNGGPRDLSFGRLIAEVPIEDMLRLEIEFPDIRSHDKTARRLAWRRVIRRYPEYRVGDKT